MNFNDIISIVRSGNTPPHNWSRGLSKKQKREVFLEKFNFMSGLAESTGKLPRSWHKGLSKTEISIINDKLDGRRIRNGERIERRRIEKYRDIRFKCLWKRVATGGGLLTVSYEKSGGRGHEYWFKGLTIKQKFAIKDFFERKNGCFDNYSLHKELDKKSYRRRFSMACKMVINGEAVYTSAWISNCIFNSINSIEYFARCFGMTTVRAIAYLIRYGAEENREERFFENLQKGLVDGFTCRKLQNKAILKIISNIENKNHVRYMNYLARKIASSNGSSEHSIRQLRALGFVA